jgi:general secretion pathway protein I
MRRRIRGFTLIEVLVALALVASALGGTLAAIRQAIASQQHLERRLLAHWVAENTLNQFVLEAGEIEAQEREGAEIILGRRYPYALTVHALRTARLGEPAGDFEVAVEVRDPGGRGTLARATRQLRKGAGA